MVSSTAQKQNPSDYRANLDILVQIPFFAGFPMDLLKVVAYLCKRGTFGADEIVFHAHEADASCYYILQGTAALYYGGDLEKPLRELSEGDFIGGLSLFSDEKRLFTMQSRSHLTCLVLSGEKFRKALERFPDASLKIFKAVVDGVYRWEESFLANHAVQCAGCAEHMGVSLL